MTKFVVMWWTRALDVKFAIFDLVAVSATRFARIFFIFFCLLLLLQFIRIDSDDEGECEDMLFPGESDTTDAAIVLLRKKLNGKYTLFKVGELSAICSSFLWTSLFSFEAALYFEGLSPVEGRCYDF